MSYLQHINTKPGTEALNESDKRVLDAHFDANPDEIVIYDQALPWDIIDEVEIAVAPRMSGPAGWLVKQLFHGGGDRYHVGIYAGDEEAVLPNITLETARYVINTVAYYAPGPVKFTAPDAIREQAGL